ncbi:MAG: arginine--tRNA ligase [Flavobacteriales bacterium]|jgi:arginyl-tRNA synthetase|nr:arginine--tRNA ligase [Flavobacteriales bacterium]
MQQIENILTSQVQKVVEELYGLENAPISFQKTRKEFEGDITLVTFPFLKAAKKKPEMVGEEIAHKLMEIEPKVVGFQVVKGFLNLSISDEYWKSILAESLKKENYGWQKANETSETVLVEFASPNTNKPLHLGHIRNILLGYSVSLINEAAGNYVKKVQVINDRGIHICKSMLAWQKYGAGETPESSEMKGDHLVGKYYVKFDQVYREEIKALKEKGMEEKEAKAQAPIFLEAQEMLRKWEGNDPEIMKLWEMMNQWVYDGFEVTFKRMGVGFDKNYYESDTYILGRDVVLEGLEKEVFYRREDQSVWCDLTDKKLDEKLVLRSDGTSVYMTQDIGTAIERHKDFSFNKMIYTVGDEQNYHFKVLFLILEKLGYSWAQNCSHLSYGMVDLPSGKMKSREGTVVDADDLMEAMFLEAQKQGAERGSYEGVDAKLQEELNEIIGQGALKYYILKVDPKKRMTFNPDESVDLQGNTAPFIQYAHARICSILRKYEGVENVDIHKAELDTYAKGLVKLIYDYPEVIQLAAQESSPALIANYTYDLVKNFNHFYQNSPILSLEDENLKALRINVCQSVAKIIKSSMSLLGIQVPDRM